MNDAAIRQAYQQLLRRREQSEPPISLDVVRELAETTSANDQQLELLDQVLSHPVTRDEYYFLRGLARAEARSRRSWIPASAAAAALVIVATGGLLMMRGGTEEPMRGGNAEVVLSAPAPDGRIASGTSFVWRSNPGATRYSVELLDADGETVWRSMTTDTSAVLPGDVFLIANARYTWFVVALRSDGTTARSPARTVIARP